MKISTKRSAGLIGKSAESRQFSSFQLQLRSYDLREPFYHLIFGLTVLSIPILQSFPFMTMLSGFTLNISIYSAAILKNLLIEVISTGLYILQNKAVDQHQKGVANGICITAMSACKIIGPAAGGAM
ncbi:unnamed protein product [Vicia faba]|uniref:Uncharacterized protein n=1 Tax=Vicia faba TaxID=3906 RepID=A0AAV0ZDZ0_VICFA|nr:unnamed protein product [Vicia faba]